jgi:hypothetical protein
MKCVGYGLSDACDTTFATSSQFYDLGSGDLGNSNTEGNQKGQETKEWMNCFDGTASS